VSPSSPDEKVVSPNQADVSEPGTDNVLTELKGSMFMNPETSLHDLIRNSEYLQKYPSWLGFCGTENKKKYAPTFIARNDTIWGECFFTDQTLWSVISVYFSSLLSVYALFYSSLFVLLSHTHLVVVTSILFNRFQIF
ncbi:hypothetical protein PHET_11274, partial [Paragonimus heterotremus]